MDGDVAPLAEIAALAREHGACLIVDDAHATGILGEGGSGLSGEADIVIGTFSKALGGFGGFVACERDRARLSRSIAAAASSIRPRCRRRCLAPSMRRSTSCPAWMRSAPGREPCRALSRRRARGGTRYRRVYHARSCRSSSARPNAALAMSERLRQAGLWATSIRPPTVPPARRGCGSPSPRRIRSSISIGSWMSSRQRMRPAGRGPCKAIRCISCSFMAGAFMPASGPISSAISTARTSPWSISASSPAAPRAKLSWPSDAIAVGHSLGLLWLLEHGGGRFRALVSVQGFDCFCCHVAPSRVAALKRGLEREPARNAPGLLAVLRRGGLCPARGAQRRAARRRARLADALGRAKR